jgi:hypothetical protein
MNKHDKSSPAFKEKKGVSIAALIVCFVVACGIWLYAQATNDDIYSKTYNQIPVIVDEASLIEFNQSNPEIDFDSLSAQFASISIRGTNRELAKIDAQNIRLAVDIRTAVDGVATVKAYLVGETGNGEKVELRDYDITPAVVTVNVSKEIECSVEMLPTTVEKVDAENNVSRFDLSLTDEKISFKVIGSEQVVSQIADVKIRLDLMNFDQNIIGQQQMSILVVSFLDAQGEELFNNSNPIDGIKYTLPTVMVNITPASSVDGSGELNGKS